jgi:hypothetical protein
MKKSKAEQKAIDDWFKKHSLINDMLDFIERQSEIIEGLHTQSKEDQKNGLDVFIDQDGVVEFLKQDKQELFDRFKKMLYFSLFIYLYPSPYIPSPLL